MKSLGALLWALSTCMTAQAATPCKLTPRDQLRDVPNSAVEKRSRLFEQICLRDKGDLIDADDVRLGSRLIQAKGRLPVNLFDHYPPRAREMGVQGTTIIAAVVEKNGSISLLTVLESSGNSKLDSAATLIARGTLKGRGYKLDGVPVRAFLTAPVKFSIQE